MGEALFLICKDAFKNMKNVACQIQTIKQTIKQTNKQQQQQQQQENNKQTVIRNTGECKETHRSDTAIMYNRG